MRSKIDKKALERWYLDRLREAISDFPPGEIEEGEEPDFVVSTRAARIGLELTRIFHPAGEGQQPLQRIEALWWGVCERAQASFERAGGDPHHVSVTYSHSVQLADSRIAAVAGGLERIVRGMSLGPGEAAEIEHDWLNRDELPDEIVAVRAWRAPMSLTCVWQPASAGFVPELPAATEQHAVEKKERCLPAYRERADEHWLVLVAEGFAVSSTFTLPRPSAFEPVRTTFDRVYVLDVFRRQAILLNTVPAE